MEGIALVGLMGVGKSSVGRKLSVALGYPFIDLDQVVEETTGISIAEIFRDFGEAQFRSLEHQRLQEITLSLSQGPVVCATGGGVVETPENRHILQTKWFTVWLDADIDTLVSHLAGDDVKVRPLLRPTSDDSSLEYRLLELYSRREPWYKQVAQMHVRLEEQTVDDVVESLLASEMVAKDYQIMSKSGFQKGE